MTKFFVQNITISVSIYKPIHFIYCYNRFTAVIELAEKRLVSDPVFKTT